MKSAFAEYKLVSFHGLFDTPHLPVPSLQPKPKYVIVQERDVSYRFYLHQHPYVKPLMQRLIRKGTPGLQAADTEYAPNGTSLPDGVDVELDANVDSTTIKAGSKIVLLADMTVPHSGGGTVNVAAKDEFELAADALAKVFAGTRATLVDALQSTPHPGVSFNLASSRGAAVYSDSLIELTADASLKWSKDSTISIPAGTGVALTAKTPFDIPSGIEVTLLRRRMQPVPDLYEDFFKAYQPKELVQRPYPVKDLDFTPSGAYSVYNWELFYHVPLTIAVHLGKNQRFAEAQHWFHYIFDPTDGSDGPTPQRFWKVRPFQYTDVERIEEILVNLATNADPDLRNDTVNSIEAWKDAPFRPHVIARYRQQSYMVKTVMAYLDNLIAWGDALFRQDTGEAIDEAMQLYVMAANILGPRPLPVPKKGTVRPQNYANLRQDLKQFGTVMRDMEAEIGFDLMPLPAADSGDNDRLATVRSLGKALYFCVPRNDTLLGYWDTVADRLFKIRNSLNFQGVFRQLALFEPPIDPALLARAAAAGLDVGAIVNGLNQPLPLVRFVFLVQKATEIVQEVKSLGNNLLSAMEKEDGEAMAILRAKHERVVMKMVEQVRYGQWQEAIKAREGLLQTLALAVQRYSYYERQLGKKADEIEKAIPALDELDKDGLDKMKFAMQEPAVGFRDIEVDIAADIFGKAAQALTGGRLLSSHEVREALLLEAGQLASDFANAASISSSASHLIPTVKAQVQPLGAGATFEFGGKELGSSTGQLAAAARFFADRLNYEARRANRIDSYSRRERDWVFQSNLAAGEVNQIFKQLRAAQIREAIAEMELKNHRQQMQHAEDIERFLNEEGTEKTGKKTNKALYAWMKREVKGLYAQCFQFAFDIAKKAERALQHELGNPQLSYLQFGYLAGKEGLLAGERLHLDIKRMEMAYHDLNQREYELTKHVSLLQLNPLALIQLRATGRCTIELPEELFDMDGPGHYFRRIKTVAVSVPCVTGPYASVNCTLTLLSSRIRTTPVVGDADDDSRFSDCLSSLQSIVTSSAQNDSGMFETNFRDDRYLPFENSGAIGKWQLQLPANPSKDEPAQFDYGTISDVILHIRYTAREGGALLRSEAIGRLKAKAIGSVRLFSLRSEFPTEWARFQNDAPVDGFHALKLRLRKEHFPFWSQARLKSSNPSRIDFLARSESSVELIYPADPGKKDALNKDMALGNILVGKLTNIPGDVLRSLPDNADDASFELSICVSTVHVMDMWIAVHW